MKKILYHPLTIFITSLIVLFSIISLRSNLLRRLSLSQDNLKSIQERYKQLKTSIAEEQPKLEEVENSLTKERLKRDALLTQKEKEIAIKLPEIIIEEDESQIKNDQNTFEKWVEIIWY